MSEYTENLNLFKYDVVEDGKVPFSIEQALNENWDIIDANVGNRVKKSGDTMTGSLTAKGLTSEAMVNVTNPNVVKGSRVTSDQYFAVIFNDNSKASTWQAQRLALMELAVKTDNSTNLTIGAYKNEANSSSPAQIYMGYNSSGQEYFGASSGVKSSITNWSFPSTKHTNLALGSSGTQYTAPADGWVCFAARASTAGQFLEIDVYTDSNGGMIATRVWSHYDGNNSIYVPIRKGNNFKIYYTMNGGLNFFGFIYAIGEA